MKKVFIIFLMLLTLNACSSLRQPEDLQGAKFAFESGNFKKSFHDLLPLAVNGNREAQYAVGYMYYYGYGVAEDTETGIFWMKRSAAQGYKPAVEALQKIT